MKTQGLGHIPADFPDGAFVVDYHQVQQVRAFDLREIRDGCDSGRHCGSPLFAIKFSGTKRDSSSSRGSRMITRVPRPGALRSEERRVGKECRSLCDWSSDVCSSDLTSRMARSSSTIIRFSRFAPSICGRLGMVAIAVVIADHLFLQSNSLELSGTHPRVAAAG